MKRFIILFLLTLIVTGCSNKNNITITNSSPPANNEDTLVLLISEPPEGLAAYQQLVEEFTKVQPDIQVTINNVPDGTEFLKRLATDIAAKSPPDVFLINYRRFGQFVIKGALEPIDNYIAESQDIKPEDFFPVALEAFKFNGNQYCIPQNISSLQVYYNKNLFIEANLPFPQKDWTMNDFLVAARALTKTENGRIVQHGLGLDPVTLRLAPFIWSHGGDLVDDPILPTRLTLNSTPSREAFQFFVDLQVVEHVVPSKIDEATEDSKTRFENGKLGMYLQSRAITPELRATIKDFDWDLAPFPRDNYVTTVLHSDGYCITKDSKNKMEAWQFIEFATNVNGQKIMAASGRTVPSRISVANSDLFLTSSMLPVNNQVYLDMASNIRSVPIMTTWLEIEDILNNEIKRAFYGDVSVDEAINSATALTQEYFRQNQRDALNPITSNSHNIFENEKVVQIIDTPISLADPALSFSPDIILTESQHQILTNSKVGQILNITSYTNLEWSVSYSPEILKPITPFEKMNNPGPSGWYFQVISPGNTEIVIESIAQPCVKDAPCNPTTIGYKYPIHIQP